MKPDRPLRIAVGTIEIAGSVRGLADGFARLGHEVTTAMRLGDFYFQDTTYDLDIEADVAKVSFDALDARVRSGAPAPRALRRGLSPIERLHWLIDAHDIFVFVFGSLFPDRAGGPAGFGFGRELELLRSLGKRIVCCFTGPEVRHASAFDQQEARRTRGRRANRLGQVAPAWLRRPVSRPLVNTRRAERWADCIFSQPNQAGLALRPYHHFFIPIELHEVRAHVPGRERPVVVHAPSLRRVKGTEQILAALDTLRGEGIDFEFRLLEDVPNAEVLRTLADADVLIDQLHLPLHGRLGVEGLATGCALATRDDRVLEPLPKERPVFDIDAHTLVPRLRRLLTDRELRVNLARQGIPYAHEHHDHVRVAQRILDCLDGHIPPEHHPTFFARHYALPEGARLTARARALNHAVAQQHGITVPRADVRGLV